MILLLSIIAINLPNSSEEKEKIKKIGLVENYHPILLTC